jgi:POT family proton-dependent oligopeptide transporter
MAIFRAGNREIKPADVRAAARPKAGEAGPAGAPFMDRSEELQRVGTLVILFFIVIFFWTAFYQNGFALTLFAERSTRVFKWLRPETYQFFEPAFILLLTPVLLALFSSLNRRGREPSTPVKIFLGMGIMSVSMLVMVAASLRGGNADVNSMSPAWLIGSYFFVTIAELLISPMGQSFVSKVAPPRLGGVMMGLWFAATAFGSYASGLMGKSYGKMAHHQFYLMLAGMLLLTAVLVLFFMKKLKRFSS